MTKRKVESITGIRIELQDKERQIVEDFANMKIASDLAASVFDSLTKMPIENMYAMLTLAEALGWVDTPIPTISDASEIASAFVSWATNYREQKNREKEEEQARKEAWQEAHEEAGRMGLYGQSPDPDTYVPRGTDPRTSEYHENYDPSNPVHRYTMDPYTGETIPYNYHGQSY